MKMVSVADSEDKFSAIFNNVPNAIILLDKDKFYDCNKKAEKRFGYTKKYLLGKSLFSFFPKKQPSGKLSEPLAKNLMKKALNGKPMIFEWTFKTKKSAFEVEVNLNLITLGRKKIMLLALRDITKRLEYRHRLKEEEVRFSLITKSTGQLFYDYDVRSGKIKWEGAVNQITGYSKFDADISQWEKSIHPEERGKIISEMKKCLLSHKPYSMEYRFRKKNGSYIWVRDIGFFSIIEGKASMLGTMQDITNEKKYLAESELSKKSIQSILDNTIDMITIIDYFGKILYETPSVKKWLGYDASELVGKSVFNFLHKEDLLFSRGLLKDVITSPHEEKHFSLRFRHKNGTFSYLEASGKNIGGKIIINSKDITEKKKANEEMVKLSAAVEQGADVIIITDTKGNIEYVNRKFSEVTGYEAKEVIGKNPRILKSGELGKEGYIKLWKTLLSGKSWHGELHNKKKDGTFYWAFVTITPIKNLDGKIINFVGVQEDITEIKFAQNALKESEERIRQVLDNLNIGIAINNIQNSRSIYFNKRFLEIYGWEKEDFPNIDSFFKKVYPNKAYREAIKTRVMADISSMAPERMRWNSLKIKTKKGEERFVNAYNIPLIKQGLMVSCVEDITDKKEAESELLKLKLGVDSSDAAIFITDINGKISYINSAFENVYGFSKEETIGNTPRILKSGLISKEQYTQFWKTLLSKKIVSGEMINKRKDGKLITIYGSNNPILDLNGELLGFLGIHRDITQIKRTEAEKEKLNETLLQKISDLERLQKLSVGRELRMIELKNRIKELEKI